MTSFYESDTKLEQYFSQGKRIDKHYDNLYLKDSDQDGFSDGIEKKWGSSSNDAQETPYATGTSAIYTDDDLCWRWFKLRMQPVTSCPSKA